ncbi:MAG: GAF domain-containing protein [Chloroflexi bacterium]|nr:GAF domain-containing protein [Chloroflexota bacterium]
MAAAISMLSFSLIRWISFGSILPPESASYVYATWELFLIIGVFAGVLFAYLNRLQNRVNRAEGVAVRRAQSLAELGRIIGTLNVLEEDFDTLANELSNLIKFDRFALVTYSSDDNKKETKFTSGVSIPEVNDVEAALWIEPQSDQPKKFGEGTITITRSIQEFQQAFPTLDGSQFAGLASRLCVPIVQKNSTVGRLIFRSYDPDAYSRHDLDLGQSIAHSIAGAIASYQHYVMLKEETAERLALARISQIISSSLDIDEIYEKFVEEVHKLIPFDRIVISLIDVENQTVQDTYIAGLQVPNRRSDDIYPLSGSFADLALNKGSVLLIQKAEDLEDIDNGVFMFMPCYESGIRSFLTVSLILNDRVIGALHLRSLQPEAYTRKDVALAESVGAQIAGAIAGSQIYSELRIAEQALQDAQEQLEQRVKDRTVKLSKANNLLQQEITERKQMEDNLLKAAAKINAQASELTITNARLTKANQAKAELLAHVSHELQTPLNAALGFARLLTEPAFGTLAPRQQHFVDNILEAGHDLLHLINDIIDASRIESGRMQLDISDVDVGGWVSSCIRILNAYPSGKFYRQHHIVYDFQR